MEILESTKFIGYKTLSGNTRVAIMQDGLSTFPINKSKLKSRLKALKRQGLPFNETEKALKNF